MISDLQPPSSSEREPARLLAVNGLTVRTKSGRTIVRDLDLHVNSGEAVGIVGESGSGKSMSAKALIGLLPSGVVASGEVRQGTRNLLDLSERAMRGVRGGKVGLVMQDPFTMLNPLLRCGAQVTDGLTDERGRRLRGAARREHAVRLLEEVGIRDANVADSFAFELSGGMRQRVCIAAALARDPELLIADESSTALDVTTQKEILELLRSLRRSRGMGLIFITHDLRVAAETCQRVYVMYAGSVLEVAPAGLLDEEPRHPYTLGLLRSEPPADRRVAKLAVIEGSVPRPDAVSGSCPFAARCEWVEDRCREARPPLEPLEGGTRWTACIRSEEIQAEMAAAREAPEAAVEPSATLSMESLLTVRNLVKVYRRQDSEVRALAGVSIDIAASESVGLVGESGSGKTTLGRCIMGLERPTSGEIVLDGISRFPREALSSEHRRELPRRVQMIFQDPYSTLNPVRTVGATLLEALIARDPRARRAQGEVERLLGLVGLPAEYAKRKPAALSGGERQRVAIARALAMRPQLIVCDEPVSALDVSVQAQVLNLLTELREELEISYLFITHDLAVVRQVVERVHVLFRGQVVESGPCSSVLDAPQHPYTRQLVASIPGADRPQTGAGLAASERGEGEMES